MRKIYFLAVLFCITGYTLPAADLINILPVTDKILMLHFDEGHIDYHGIGQDRINGNKLYYSLFNTSAVNKFSTYSITSQDDPNYSSAKNPVTIGRKSKGVDFHDIYDTSKPAALKEHFIYIELPTAMVAGKTYEVSLVALADNLKSYTVLFDTKSIRSETVHVNQAGFTPESKKYAYLAHWMGDFSSNTHQQGGLKLDDYSASEFHLIDQHSGAKAFTGKITKRKDKSSPESDNTEFGPNKNFTNADVWQCDFSSFSTPGGYVVSVDRIGCSYPFEIKADVYRAPFAAAMKGLFLQRAGVEKEVESGWVLKRDFHPDNGTQKFYYDASTVSESHDNPNFNYTQEVNGIWGWYHDAGDWDHYPTHALVSAVLMHLYDLKPNNFQDGDIRNMLKYKPSDAWSNEGNNGIPDLLDEASWLLKFFHRGRHALMSQNLGTGGVPGYTGVDGGFGNLPSWEDTRKVMVTGENPVSTYSYAGLAAKFAVCLRNYNSIGGSFPQDSIDYWIAEAKSAYDWAETKTGNFVPKVYAAAALYNATGEAQYQNTFKSLYKELYLPGWYDPTMDELAALLYAVIPAETPNLDVAFQNKVGQDMLAKFEPQIVDYNETSRGYRWISPQMTQLHMLGTFSTPKALWSATAHHITGQAKFLDAVRATADYVLGGNEMNMVSMTGHGYKSDLATFHLDSWYSRDFNSMVYRNPIIPGLVPYGSIRNCDWMDGCDYKWVGDEDFSRSTAYPNINLWPQSETRFQNKESIAGSEFTIHQTQALAIFTFGYLCGTPGEKMTPVMRPTVSLNLTENQIMDMKDPFMLSANASTDTKSVSYYFDWHFIGTSTDVEHDFAFSWDLLESNLRDTEKILVTAVADNGHGLNSIPLPAGEKNVKLTCTDCKILGLNEPKTDGIRIAPNPSNNSYFSILIPEPYEKKAIISVTNTAGKVMIREKSINTSGNSISIHHQLNPGIYIVEVKSMGKRYNEKILIE